MYREAPAYWPCFQPEVLASFYCAVTVICIRIEYLYATYVVVPTAAEPIYFEAEAERVVTCGDKRPLRKMSSARSANSAGPTRPFGLYQAKV